jgi:hypothetical protein
MSTFYSFEKGKFGGVVGTIYPFPLTLNGDRPSESDWKQYVPAGFLRCDGSILKADEYPALANVIGVGDDCIYRKNGVILENRDENGKGGEIQIPDLGSKSLTAFSSNTGLILDATAENPNSTAFSERVGIGVDLELNQGQQITVNYSGNFSVPTTPIPISGNYTMEVPAVSPLQTFTQDQLLSHGHYSNVARALRGVGITKNFATGTAGGVTDVSPEGVVADVIAIDEISIQASGSLQSTEHIHGISRTNPTTNISAQLNSFEIDASAVSTTVNLGTSGKTAFNDVTQKFILVEYLIKF